MNKQEKNELTNYIEKHTHVQYTALGRMETVRSNALIDKIKQLDEPQKVSWRKAISVLEHHFQCEIPRNLDQVIEGFNSMSGLLNSVEFELDKQGSKLTSKEFVLEALERYKQKVKVPAFVAEWFEENKHSLNFAIYELCEAGKVPVDLYEGLTDFEQWFYLNNDIETLIRMLDGYEVEEDPKYRVLFPNTTDPTFKHCYLKKGRGICYSDSLDSIPEFTEKEIKAIDERYWPFAVPVEEV